MKNAWPALALSLLCGAAHTAPVISAPIGEIAGQSALTALAYDRFDTEFAYQESDLAQLLGGDAFSAPLRAVGNTVTVKYLGTTAAHGGKLFLSAAEHGGELFQTRSGLSADAAVVDPFGFIDTIGTQRDITGLAAFEELRFGFDAWAYAGDAAIPGNAAAQVLATTGGARAVHLSGNEWLIGFETFGATDYADAVMLVSGVTFAAPTVQEVPTPGSLPLSLAALALLGAFGRQPSRRRRFMGDR